MAQASSSASPKAPDSNEQLRHWDLRLAIAIPALMVLLVIAVGLTDYLLVLHANRQAPNGTGAGEVSTALQENVLAALLISVGLTVASGLGLAWTILKPIHRLASAVSSIGKGNLEQPLEIRGGFEISQLGKSFSSVIRSLHATIEERDTFLNEGLSAGSIIIDTHGVITSANNRALQILQAEQEDLVSKKLEDALENAPQISETFFRFCRSQLRDITSSSQAGDCREERIEGDKPLAVVCAPIYSEGKLSSMAVHFRDLSRIRNLNLLFSRTDQLAALGTFTMGLSHELRNPLAAIKGSAQLLQEKAQGDPAYAPFTQNITREVDRLDKLVRELYDFSRSPGGPRSVTDLSELAREALSQVLRGTPEDKKNSRKIAEFHAPGLPHAMIQKDRMLQAVCNVIQNALEHMPEGADLTVRTFLRQEPPQHMVLEIANTGSSIASADMERIFEPFFSTKSAGMGLGLAIAYQIAAQNRCHLKALSDSDSVRFQFLFRPSAPQIPAAQAEGSSISG